MTTIFCFSNLNLLYLPHFPLGALFWDTFSPRICEACYNRRNFLPLSELHLNFLSVQLFTESQQRTFWNFGFALGWERGQGGNGLSHTGETSGRGWSKISYLYGPQQYLPDGIGVKSVAIRKTYLWPSIRTLQSPHCALLEQMELHAVSLIRDTLKGAFFGDWSNFWRKTGTY